MLIGQMLGLIDFALCSQEMVVSLQWKALLPSRCSPLPFLAESTLGTLTCLFTSAPDRTRQLKPRRRGSDFVIGTYQVTSCKTCTGIWKNCLSTLKQECQIHSPQHPATTTSEWKWVKVERVYISRCRELHLSQVVLVDGTIVPINILSVSPSAENWGCYNKEQMMNHGNICSSFWNFL